MAENAPVLSPRAKKKFSLKCDAVAGEIGSECFSGKNISAIKPNSTSEPMITLFGPFGALFPNPEGTRPWAGSKRILVVSLILETDR